MKCLSIQQPGPSAFYYFDISICNDKVVMVAVCDDNKPLILLKYIKWIKNDT